VHRAIVLHATCVLVGLSQPGCRESNVYADGELEHNFDRPQWVDAENDVAPYEGTDADVIEAQANFVHGLDVQQKIIWRTCTPNDGVCHNRKEYPDLRTPTSFLAAFDAPCNIQPGEFSSVYDGCERPGDVVTFRGQGSEGAGIELAYLVRVAGEPPENDDESLQPDADTPGLHVYLAQPLKGDRDYFWGNMRLSRRAQTGETITEIEYARIDTLWYALDDGRHLYGIVYNYLADDIAALAAQGVIEGDANRNGIFGAKTGKNVAMLAPGRPEDSYLIARMRGQIHGENLPGSRMPLANQPLSVPEMLALFCLVEGFGAKDRESGLMARIDYNACSYAKNPGALNLLGEGVTWSSRVSKIFEFNCGGCHTGDEPAAGLELVQGDVYSGLLGASQQKPELRLIAPSDPKNSYLYLKLIGDASILGNPMPFNPLTGTGRLSEAELNDVLTWITNGAVEDQ
jgi:hypothetical protein